MACVPCSGERACGLRRFGQSCCLHWGQPRARSEGFAAALVVCLDLGSRELQRSRCTRCHGFRGSGACRPTFLVSQ